MEILEFRALRALEILAPAGGSSLFPLKGRNLALSPKATLRPPPDHLLERPFDLSPENPQPPNSGRQFLLMDTHTDILVSFIVD